jgi:SAM-dependent methyltransferase
MLTGYEQVRSVVAALAGDLKAAQRVELALPSTGVCSSTPLAPATACCDTTAPEAVAAAAGATGCCTPSPAAEAAGACCAPAPGATEGACCAPTPPLITNLAQPKAKETTTMDAEDTIKDTVKAKYGAAALRVASGSASCCGGTAARSTSNPITSNLYGEETAELPPEALAASLGCGNPTALAELRPGDVVLDLGSGGGIDVLLSARRVGPEGKAYGLDMTDEMLALARENQSKAGVTNVEFLKGEIEHMPLPDAAVDVIISNCVINLSPDKDAVLAEAFRVLKPGGRFAVSDVVVRGEVPAVVRKNMELWIGCIAGALEESDYHAKLQKAGFEAIDVEPTRVYSGESARERLSTAGLDAAAIAAVEGKFISAFIRARKPSA